MPTPDPLATLRAVDLDHLLATAERLSARVGQRFPGSGLARVAAELVLLVREADVQSRRLARPLWSLRLGAGLCIGLLAGVAGMAVAHGIQTYRELATSFSDLAQGIDATVNEILLLSAAIYFLVTAERRTKRMRALRLIHELRSLAHIIDMHQLTKDPEVFRHDWEATPASPDRSQLTPFALSRYLDYCSEMLALLGKVAALYVQRLPDESVLQAVDDVEDLTIGLSRKIWQKMSLLEPARRTPPGD